MTTRVGGTPADAAFINQMVKDLRETPALPDEVSAVVRTAVQHATWDTLISDKMLGETWTKMTGKPIDDQTFRRVRAEVFFAILAREEYQLDETRLRGDAAVALRSLATTASILDVSAATNDFLTKHIGGPINEVDVSVGNGRVYLRTADANRGDYMPTEGLGVVYRYGDDWKLSVPSKDGSKSHDIPLGSTPKANEPARDPDLELPSSLATRSQQARQAVQEQNEARTALRELVLASLSLPDPKGLLVREMVNPEDRGATRREFLIDLLKALDHVDGVTTPVPAPMAVPTPTPLNASELSPTALEVIEAFRDRKIAWTGLYANDTDKGYEARVRAKAGAQEGVTELIGFVAGQTRPWGLLQVERASDAPTKADVIVNGMRDERKALFDKHKEQHKLAAKDIPAPVRSWIEKNMRSSETLLGFNGNAYIPGCTVERVDEIKIDGEVFYAAFFTNHNRFGNWPKAAVFAHDGTLIYDDCSVGKKS